MSVTVCARRSELVDVASVAGSVAVASRRSHSGSSPKGAVSFAGWPGVVSVARGLRIQDTACGGGGGVAGVE
jgi:hypothetical protein